MTAPAPVAVMLALAIGGCSPLGVVAVPEAISVFTTIIEGESGERRKDAPGGSAP